MSPRLGRDKMGASLQTIDLNSFICIEIKFWFKFHQKCAPIGYN